MLRYRKQILDRRRSDDERLMTLAAFGVSPTVRNGEVGPAVVPVGTLTYFVLRRAWVRTADDRSVRAIVLAGYKAAHDRTAAAGEPAVVLGGGGQNVCLYDLRYAPVPNARPGGRILDITKYTTLRAGLVLDAAVEAVGRGEVPAGGEFRLPAFWAAFQPDDLPETEDCPAARRAALAAVRPGDDGATLPSLRALGGRVTVVVPDAEGGVAVGFGGTAENPDEVQVLPRTAVLRPYVRPGVVIAPGAALGDFLPRRVYPSMARVAELYGADVAAWLLQEAAAAGDEVRDGLVLRRVELCPSAVARCVRVYEDVRELVGADWSAAPQVFRARRPEAYQAVRGLVRADLYGLNPKWGRPLAPAVSRHGKEARRGQGQG
jgi:hypothetical protein